MMRVTSTMPELGARLRAARARAADVTAALLAPAEDARRLVAQSFRGARSPDGTAWEPLAEATIERRREGRGEGPRALPLMDTGILRNAAIGGVRVARNAILFTAQVPYAAVHLVGTTRAGRSRRVRIPARPYLPITPSLRLMTTGPAARWVERLLRYVGTYVEKGQLS